MITPEQIETIPAPIRKRIERAAELAAECAAIAARWLSDNPQEITVEWLADDQLNSVWLEPTAAALPDISVPLSECVHHARGALDNIIDWTINWCTGQSNPSSQFLVRSSEKKFREDSRRYLAGVPDDVLELIELVQPYRVQPDDPDLTRLSVIVGLSNQDKHRMLAPTRIVYLNPENYIGLAAGSPTRSWTTTEIWIHDQIRGRDAAERLELALMRVTEVDTGRKLPATVQLAVDPAGRDLSVHWERPGKPDVYTEVQGLPLSAVHVASICASIAVRTVQHDMHPAFAEREK